MLPRHRHRRHRCAGNLTRLNHFWCPSRDLAPLAALTALKALMLNEETADGESKTAKAEMFDDVAPLAALTQLEELHLGDCICVKIPSSH